MNIYSWRCVLRDRAVGLRGGAVGHVHLADVHGEGPGPRLEQQEGLEGEGGPGKQQVGAPHRVWGPGG